ncbi:MAG: hypothetical protein M1457_11960 [bacterium]|nr:hypothetical protein [bacterium]
MRIRLFAVLSLVAVAWAGPAPGFEPVKSARVEVVNGMPRLMVNGRPVPPTIFFFNTDVPGWEQTDWLAIQVGLARQAGVHIYSMPLRTVRASDGVTTDWAKSDRLMDAFIALDPQAMFILRLWPGPNWSWKEWKDINPGEMMLYADGTRGLLSLASDYFWGPCDADLASIVRHYEASPYGPRILVYQPGGGNSEMFPDQFREKGPDYSAPNVARFRRWLAAKYKTDAALRTAWGATTATLQTAAIPPFDPARFPMHMTPPGQTVRIFYNPPAEQDWIDYSAYMSSLTADRIISWARVIKRESGGRKLSDFFYGYLFELPGSMAGHWDFQRVLECPDVDIISSPYCYDDRDVGGTGNFMSAVDSLALHGKLWLNEDDTRTCQLIGRVNNTQLNFNFSTGGETIDETLGILDRNFASLLAHRSGSWWMDLLALGAFDHPAMWIMRRRHQDLYTRLCAEPRPYRPDVAVLGDDASKLIVRGDWDANKILMTDLHDEALKTGATIGYYTLADFIAGRTPPCKVCVFANAFRLDEGQVAAIRERLDREGATAVWSYAPGCYGPAGIDAALAAPLIGMPLVVSEGASGTDGAGPLAGEAWGTTMCFSPRLALAGGGAEPLGRYRAGGGVSAARVRDSRHESVWLGEPGVKAGALRRIFAAAGAHIWTSGGEIVQTDGRWLAIHSGHDGDVTIALPAGFGIEPLAGTPGRREGNAYVAHFARGQTRWFELQPPAGLQTKWDEVYCRADPAGRRRASPGGGN